MKITSLAMSGFRYVTDKESISYNFSNFTSISGENETGKTTIQEAIVWGLTGCNLNGNDKANTLLQNKNSKNMYVEVKFIDNNGITHTVERSTGSKTTIALDGKIVKQEEIYTYTADKDTFLSVFVPGYFESRDTTKTRKFLMDVMPVISKEEIIAQLPENYKNEVSQRGTLDPAGFIKDKRKEIKENDSKLIELKGKLTVVKENLKQVVPEAKIFDNSKIIEFENQKQTLLSKRPELPTASELNIELLGLSSLKPELADVSILVTKIISLGDEYKKEKNNLKQINIKAGDICSFCEQVIAEDFVKNVEKSINKHNDTVKIKIAELHTQAKETNVKVREIEKTNIEIQEKFNKDLIAKKADIQSKIDKIVSDNEKLEKDFTDSVQEELSKINTQLIELREQESKITEHNATVKSLIDTVEKAKKQKIGIEADISCTENDSQLSEDAINVMTEYSKIKTEILATNVAKYLDKVTIKLEKFVVSTGEIKECFEILYDNANDITCEGVLLSTSTKIRKDLEIANMVNVITGLNLPIFIDCAESITHYKKPQCDQIFEAKVVEEQELIVR